MWNKKYTYYTKVKVFKIIILSNLRLLWYNEEDIEAKDKSKKVIK